jgi:hypothetical protein
VYLAHWEDKIRDWGKLKKELRELTKVNYAWKMGKKKQEIENEKIW